MFLFLSLCLSVSLSLSLSLLAWALEELKKKYVVLVPDTQGYVVTSTRYAGVGGAAAGARHRCAGAGRADITERK